MVSSKITKIAVVLLQNSGSHTYVPQSMEGAFHNPRKLSVSFSFDIIFTKRTFGKKYPSTLGNFCLKWHGLHNPPPPKRAASVVR